MTQKNIRLQNSSVFYAVAGTGLPVMLVHGFAEDQDIWKYQQEVLQQHCRLIIPDLPGSGQSDRVDDMSMEGLAAVLYRIIEQEYPLANDPEGGFEGIIMIGHSMGGYITLAFAEKYPALLHGFGLFHASVFADSEEKIATRRRSISFIQSHGSNEFIKQSVPNLFTEAFRIKNEPAIAEMMARYGNFDPLSLVAYYEAMIQRPHRAAVAASFNKPVLFIIGKKDKAVTFEDSMRQCHLPSLASVQILENAAHMGMWEEKEMSTQILLDFLQDATV